MKRSFVIVIIFTLLFTVASFQKVSSVPPGGDCDPLFEICFDDGDDPGDIPDDLPPTIQVDDSPIYMNTVEMLVLPECEAFDDNDPYIECDIESNVDILQTGNYYVKFQATDNTGKMSEEITIDVYVEKNYPSFVYPNTEVYIPENVLFIDYSVRAFDNNKLKARFLSDEDSRFYSFIVNEENLGGSSGNVEVQIDEITYGDNVNLYLYDHEGELIYESENALNYDEEISFTAFPGVYYFEVRKVTTGDVSFRMDINGITNYTSITPGQTLQTTGNEVYVMEYTSATIDTYKYYIPASLLNGNLEHIEDIMAQVPYSVDNSHDYIYDMVTVVGAGSSILYGLGRGGVAWAAKLSASASFATPLAFITVFAANKYFYDKSVDANIQNIIDTVAEGNSSDYIVITAYHIDGDRSHQYFRNYEVGTLTDLDYTVGSFPYVYQVEGIDINMLYYQGLYFEEYISNL